MPLKFKNIPKRPHKTIWYHLMNFFVPHILSAEIRTFEEPCAKDLLIAEKNDILWNSSTTLICVHYTISTPFATKLRGSCGKNLLFRRNFRSIFPCIIPWLPRKKSGFFKKKLQKTLTLWPIFGPKIGLLVRFLDHMMQNFKYNYKVTTSTFTKSAQKSVSLTERLMVSCSIYVRGELGGLATRAGQRSLLEMLPMHSL